MRFYKFFLTNNKTKIFDIVELLDNNKDDYNEKDFLLNDKNYTFDFIRKENYYFFEIKCGKNNPNKCRDIEKCEFVELDKRLFYIDNQIFILISRNKQENYVYISNKDKKSLFLELLKNFKIDNINIENQTIDRNECFKKFKDNVKKLTKISIRCRDSLFLTKFFTLGSGVEWDNSDIENIYLTLTMSAKNVKKIIKNVDIFEKNTTNFLGTLLLEGENKDDDIITINEDGFFESIIIDTDNLKKDEDDFFCIKDICDILLLTISKKNEEKDN